MATPAISAVIVIFKGTVRNDTPDDLLSQRIMGRMVANCIGGNGSPIA